MIHRVFQRTWFVLLAFAPVAGAQELTLQDAPPPLPNLTYNAISMPNHIGFTFIPEPDKPPITGFVGFPEGIGPYRTVIVIHSVTGIAKQGVANYGANFVERGYAIITADLKFDTSKPQESDWDEMFRRLEACLEIIQADERLDEQRVFIYGNGAGAMTALAFAAKTGKLRGVGVTGAGMIPKGGLAYDKVAAPVMMVHGAKDQSVPLEDAMKLKANLESAGKTVEVKVFEHSGHEVVTLKKGDVFDALVGFFNKLSR